MATAESLISEAMGLIGVKDPAQPIDGRMAQSALVRLNTMMDGWKLDSLTAYQVSRVSASVSTATSTIGPAATFNVTTRPEQIELGSFITSDGVDYDIQPITAQQYDQIPVKSNGSLGPRLVYMDRGYPTATLYFYPVPSSAVTVTLLVQTQLSEFADLTTDYALAPGYRRLIVNALACELAPDYEREPPPSVLRAAATARRAVARVNARVPQLNIPVGIPVNAGWPWWRY